MDIELLVVPYDSGHRAERFGRGPLRLLEAGIVDRLEAAGRAVTMTEIEAAPGFRTENALAFELAGRIARAVRAAREAGRFPLVLSGNCFSAVGTVAGVGPDRTALVWFDSHGDLNTPETSASAFLDGMAVATLLGRCWKAAAGRVPGFAPVAERAVILLAVRDLDPPERALVEGSGVELVTPGSARGAPARAAVAAALDGLPASTEGAYLHIDLDVLDPDVAHVNEYAAPDGLRVEDVIRVVDAVADRLPLAAAAFTSYDPSLDDDGRAAGAALAMAGAIAGRLG